MSPRANRTTSLPAINPQDPGTWLRPGEPLIGADGRDWSWCYVWHKDVEGFPGYKVGWDGAVWSCFASTEAGCSAGSRSVLTDRWHRISGGRDTGGYPAINLCRNGRILRRTIHRLILEAFVGPRPPGLQCRHLDGNPGNSRCANLAWGTVKANQLDRVRHGTHLFGSRVGSAKLDEPAVDRIRRRYEEMPNKKRLAAEFGVSRQVIGRIVEGEGWKHVPCDKPVAHLTREGFCSAMTEGQLEMLGELLRFTDRADADPASCQWAKPRDLDGREGSDHGRTLKQLTKKGLAERKQTGGTQHEICTYRISPAGREILRKEAVAN